MKPKKIPATGHWMNPNICHEEQSLFVKIVSILVVIFVTIPILLILFLGAYIVKSFKHEED